MHRDMQAMGSKTDGPDRATVSAALNTSSCLSRSIKILRLTMHHVALILSRALSRCRLGPTCRACLLQRTDARAELRRHAAENLSRASEQCRVHRHRWPLLDVLLCAPHPSPLPFALNTPSAARNPPLFLSVAEERDALPCSTLR